MTAIATAAKHLFIAAPINIRIIASSPPTSLARCNYGSLREIINSLASLGDNEASDRPSGADGDVARLIAALPRIARDGKPPKGRGRDNWGKEISAAWPLINVSIN